MDARDPAPGVSVYGLTNQADALTQLSVLPWLVQEAWHNCELFIRGDPPWSRFHL